MLERKYICYYIFGYLNMYYSNKTFAYDPQKESYAQYKLRSTLRYLGLKDINHDLLWLAPPLSWIEFIFSILLVSVRFAYVAISCMYKKKRSYKGRVFFASLIFAPFRLKNLLESVRPLEISTIKIPFIKNGYSENEVNILSVVTIGDVCKSLLASWKTILLQFRKYRRRDPLFRSFSCFEYYLTCCFVKRMEGVNRFLYYSTYDRWAFLMCNTCSSIFIQHGKLIDSLKLIKVGTPSIAYYLNKRQSTVLEKILFKSVPSEMGFRNLLEFSCNELLQHNGKKNVLLVCWNNNIEYERRICELLHHNVNLYIKPHPGDKNNPNYPYMARQYHCIIVPKTGYPHVDLVISYDSTLADEYEDVGVTVIRYDLLDSLEELEDLV